MAAAASQRPPLKKRLIVCCDGTWNNSVSTNSPLTNVSRLSRCIDNVGADGTPQIIYYHTGIGSGTSTFSNTVDAAIGRGIHYIIKNVYTFICLNVNNPEDEIFLIGFSRGAYTVRRIASLIVHAGLLTKTGLGQINYLYERWVKLESAANPDKAAFDKVLKDLQDLDQLRTNIEIEACAVWETVGALGVPEALIDYTLNVALGGYPMSIHLDSLRKVPAFHSEEVPPRLKNAFHAVALDEWRKDYKPTLWEKLQEPTNIRQCWFLGSHSDVGGGYEECWLANITLLWMIAQLRKYTELVISDEYLKQYLDPTGLSHPRVNPFIVHKDVDINSADPSIALNSKNPRLAIRKGFVNDSFKKLYVASGSVSFRTPGQRGDPVVPETMHSSVRILMSNKAAHASVMEQFKTEILSQENDPLGTEHRVTIWRRSNPEGWRNLYKAGLKNLSLKINTEGEIYEDLLCDEEAHLINLWIGVLTPFVATDDDEVKRLAKIEKKKNKTRVVKKGHRQLNITMIIELLGTLIYEAHEPTRAWMFPCTEEASGASV